MGPALQTAYDDHRRFRRYKTTGIDSPITRISTSTAHVQTRGQMWNHLLQAQAGSCATNNPQVEVSTGAHASSVQRPYTSFDVAPLQLVIQSSIAQQRFTMLLLSAFGLILLLWAVQRSTGYVLYSCTADKEIGVLLAFGAQRGIFA